MSGGDREPTPRGATLHPEKKFPKPLDKHRKVWYNQDVLKRRAHKRVRNDTALTNEKGRSI